MNIVQETKACESCAKSKRKCGKERPKCHRCSSRDLQCDYPPAPPSSFVLLQDECEDVQSCKSSLVSTMGAQMWSPGMLLGPLTDFEMPTSSSEFDGDLGRSLSGTAFPKHLVIDWFMAPETWNPSNNLLEPPEPQPQSQELQSQPTPPYGNVVLKRFLKDIQQRLGSWVSTGGNTFIHKSLYIFRRPRCILDAQTALAMYLARTDEIEEAVFSMLEDRATQLLEDEKSHSPSSSHNSFDHLARVQSLLTYQVLGLLDGDIRQRAMAEQRMQTLMRWVDQMVDGVRTASFQCFADTTGDPITVAKELGLGITAILTDSQTMHPNTHEEIVWHAWIFTESLRRTWITVQGLNATYHALQNGWAICPGTMKVTAGQGVWDAPSSFAWAKIVRETNIWFMEGTDTDLLLTYASPEEVDDFTKACMEVTHGLERMERWGARGVS